MTPARASAAVDELALEWSRERCDAVLGEGSFLPDGDPAIILLISRQTSNIVAVGERDDEAGCYQPTSDVVASRPIAEV